MTVAEAIEMVLVLAKERRSKNPEHVRAIEIVETIVLYHYKTVDTKNGNR